MIILVVNAGSTSYKCRCFTMPAETELARGEVERVGSADAAVSYWKGGAAFADKKNMPVATHADAAAIINDFLCSPSTGVVKGLKDIAGVGFKTIQAGEKNGTVLLTGDVLEAMDRYAPLAPAHNPPYLACIRSFKETLPGTPLVGVFEPGFHTHIPEYARIFGAPYEWYEKFQVKKYGYHGATFRYVTDYTINALGLPREKARIIACHLGGSSSVCAFGCGRSQDVSMTFTPQSGLLQSGRTGDIDPYVLPYIMQRKNIGLNEALAELSSNGGLKGISGTSGDLRDIQAAAGKGDKRAVLAIDKFVYDVVRYIGSYWALLQGADAIAFTGGIGFKNPALRAMIIDKIAFLGITMDPAKRDSVIEGTLTKASSKIAVLAVNTNEEIVVARETVKIIESLSKDGKA